MLENNQKKKAVTFLTKRKAQVATRKRRLALTRPLLCSIGSEGAPFEPVLSVSIDY